jgi:hypothetical protein
MDTGQDKNERDEMVANLDEANKRIKELENKNKVLELDNRFRNDLIQIHKSSQNVGEKDEMIVIMQLFNHNRLKDYDNLVKIFGDEASEGVAIINTDTNAIITDTKDIRKASGNYKADISIQMNKTNMIYPTSIKSKNGANAAILNHTPRTAKVFMPSGCLHKHLPSLDVLLHEYKYKRMNKQIGEDVYLHTLDCIKYPTVLNGIKESISYFTFDGTGKGDSKSKANCILYYENDNILFIKCCDLEEKKKYVDSIIAKCIISLRDKGMPKKICEENKPWIFSDVKLDGTIKLKGSLHIRLK